MVIQRIFALSAFAVVFLSGAARETFAQVELFVAIDGDDSQRGSSSEPLATIEGARLRILELRNDPSFIPQPITVTVRSGLYELSQPLTFNEQDSGLESERVVYRAEEPRQVVLRAGKSIHNFHRVADESCDHPFPNKANVWRIDLAGLDLPALDKNIRLSRTRSLHQAMHAEPIHLVANGAMLDLARWPSSGWAQANQVGLDKTSWSIPTAELGDANFPYGPHAWAHGFWKSDWEDACHAVEFTTTDAITNIRFCESTACEVRAGARFRIENIATQLDANGEWFLDADARQVYLYHEQTEPSSVFIPHIACPVSFYGVSHVDFVGFTIEGASNCGIEIAGGESVKLSDCEIRNVGNTCVHLFQGSSHEIADCELHDAGAGGVRIEAGDRASLTPANHRISNNEIYDYSHCQLAYRPAVNAIGVGIRIEGNNIHDGPHAAIILEGNELEVVGNRISNVCLETDDVGAIYIGGNPTFRGNLITGNHIHHLGNSKFTGVVGIYLDDFTSGTVVSDNVLQSMPRGIVIGGGRDNLIEGNVVVDCLAAVQADDRGATWGAEFVASANSVYSQLCKEVLSNEAYLERYPQLASLLDDAPELPKGNKILGNWIDSRVRIDLQGESTKRVIAVERNVVDAYRYLVDVGDGEFELNAAGEAMLAGLQPDSSLKSRYIRRVDTNSEKSPSDRSTGNEVH